MDKIALTNVRVFDGERLLEPTTVVIDGDRIGDDQAGARTWDGGGGVLLPGLIDCHIHLTDDATLSALARYGVTTGLDMGTWPPELVASLRGRPGVTDVRSSGTGATHPASMHAKRMGRAQGLVADPGEARAYVAQRVAESVDYIKIIVDPPGFDELTVRALVEAAHAHGLRTIAHAATRDAVLLAQAGGVDVLTHAPIDRPLEDSDVQRARARGQVVVPTLTMMEAIVERLARQRTRLLRRRPSHRRAVVPGGRHDPRRDRREPGSIRARIPAVWHQPAPRAAAAGRRGPVRRRCAAVSDNSRGPVLRTGRSWGYRTGQAGRPGPHRR